MCELNVSRACNKCKQIIGKTILTTKTKINAIIKTKNYKSNCGVCVSKHAEITKSSIGCRKEAKREINTKHISKVRENEFMREKKFVVYKNVSIESRKRKK